MKNIKWISCLLGVLIFTGCQPTQRDVNLASEEPFIKQSNSNEKCVCDEFTSQLVARTYVLSMPFLGRENELISLMKSNPSYFTENGKAIQCMQSLGNTLMARGLTQIDTNRPTWGEINNPTNIVAMSTHGMGQELLWLSLVLPDVAEGNFASYNAQNTDSRKQIQNVCANNPSACQYLLTNSAPTTEQQIYTLAKRQQLEGNCPN